MAHLKNRTFFKCISRCLEWS